ncbi:cytochrome c biogenesis protein CcdA [Oleidesulfovibrio sp.]|uniref:protein-disulfide reductase DsbD family protein n=1 Tax=Oleidesulfovibrio sp. TaxID=2909707 RepID=UPI003A892471
MKIHFFLFRFITCFALLLLLQVTPARAVELPPVPAQDATQAADPLTAHAEAFSVNAAGFARQVIVLTLTPAEGYHFYAHDPGGTGRPVSITALANETEPRILYPAGKPKKDTFDPSVTVNVHDGPTRFFLPVDLEHLQQGDTVPVSWSVTALMCSDVNCWPVSREGVLAVSSSLPRAEAQPWWNEYAKLLHSTPDTRGATAGTGTSPQIQPKQPDTTGYSWDFSPRYYLESLEVQSLGKALLFGLIAGFILNFMPCVLPVVSLKLSTLLSASGIEDPKKRTAHFRQHNIWFSAGIMCFFLLLAVVLSAAGLAWGSAFQNKTVVAALVLLVFTLGLSMFGVFNLPVLDLKAQPKDEDSSPRSQAFFTGIMATLLATPCSGPFLGGVLGWAFIQPPLILGGVFTSVGVGMALPYLLMAARPSLVSKFPKPGSWISILERLVGFFLMGTALYLLQILPPSIWPAMLALMLVTALAAWVWGRFSGLEKSFKQRLIVRSICILLVTVFAWWLSLPPSPHPGWKSFNALQFKERLEKQNIIVDFTADWCPNCKVLEQTTLHAENLQRWVEEYDALLIQVDLTEPFPEGDALLRSLGSSSIPVVALFPKGRHADKPLILRDVFTTSQMEEALFQAFGLSNVQKN